MSIVCDLIKNKQLAGWLVASLTPDEVTDAVTHSLFEWPSSLQADWLTDELIHLLSDR